MSSISKLLDIKDDKEILVAYEGVVIEGGGIYQDHDYLITFTMNGTRCGYVSLKPEEAERFKQESLNDPDYYPHLNCHGGITFFGSDHGAKDLLPVHYDDVWVGFDAAHGGDAPDLDTAERYFGKENRYIQIKRWVNNKIPFVPYFLDHRSYEYMEKECHDIIDQLVLD